NRGEQRVLADDGVTGGVEPDPVDGVVERGGEEVPLHGTAEVGRRVLGPPIRRGREGGQRAVLGTRLAVVALDGVRAGNRRLGVGGVELVRRVPASRVGVAAVVAGPGDQVEAVAVGRPRLVDVVGAGAAGPFLLGHVGP